MGILVSAVLVHFERDRSSVSARQAGFHAVDFTGTYTKALEVIRLCPAPDVVDLRRRTMSTLGARHVRPSPDTLGEVKLVAICSLGAGVAKEQNQGERRQVGVGRHRLRPDALTSTTSAQTRSVPSVGQSANRSFFQP